MKSNNHWLLLALGFWALLALPVNAQIYSVLYSFTNSPDGSDSQASLTLSGNVLYGTTYTGGSSGNGTVFKVNTDGSGYTVLKRFTNSPDGSNPCSSLTLSGNVLYGTTERGGSSGNGTVFQINTDGTGFMVLKNFQYTDGANPIAGLILSSNMLYGATSSGGSSGRGTVFKVNTDGMGYTMLKQFTNSPDGASPWASLTLSGNVLYGTTEQGGSSGNGTVFKVNTDGTGYALLRSFQLYYGEGSGSLPLASLTLSGNVLYGTTLTGGSSGNGTVFQINTDGTGFMVLKNFNGVGANPYGCLTLSGNVLYGTTGFTSGSSGNGTVFQINTDGTGYTVLRQFTNSPDGANPYAGMILSSNVLYGTTGGGGSAGCGTVFSLYGGPYPIVVSQPQNQIASVSNAVSFSVTAGWTAPFGYQWYFTNTTFQTAGAYAQALSGFVYGCLVTNGGYGYTTVPQVQFIGGGGTGAAGYAVVSNGLVTGITVTNTGSGYTSLPLVQIDSPNGLLVNKTNVTLNVSAVTTNNVGFYFAVITNAYGSVTSSVASLNLSASIVNQPQSLMVLAGNSAAFAVTGDNTGPFTYQWQFGGTKIIGATNASYTVNPVATNNAGTYTVAVSNIYGGIISSGALLTVSYISQPPASQSVTNGGTANFNVGVTGSGSFTYQWQFNGTNLQSATQSTLSLTNVAAGNAGNYAVVITAASGSVTSSPAVLNILYPPSILQQPQRMTVAQGNNATSGITAGGTAPFGYQWWMISGTQSNATAVPVVINGFVLGANMTSGGAGYLAVPTVQFVGGSGSSAGGNAVVSNRMVTTIIITNTGSGYTTPPTIQIGAPSAIALTGQTNATLTLVSVTNGNAANYFVVVTNNYGSITSSIASLIVAPVGYNQISTPVLSNGKMSLSFVGVQGTNYALDRSFTLSPANWIPQVTNPADANGNLIFTNAPDPTTNNFWRIRSVP